jgi:hypothetical protein
MYSKNGPNGTVCKHVDRRAQQKPTLEIIK